MTAPGEERGREKPQVCNVGPGFLVLRAQATAGQRLGQVLPDSPLPWVVG